MADRDAFDERRRAQEEGYFRRKEQELIEKMRERARAASDAKGLADATGVADEGVLATLRELGFTAETVSLLHAVPLVQVAWADGDISARERELIVEMMSARGGVDEGSAARAQLDEWLTRRPSGGFFEGALNLLRTMVKAHLDDGGARAEDLAERCTRIAEASGGVLGFGRKISDAERAVIERVAREIESAHADAARQVVSE